MGEGYCEAYKIAAENSKKAASYNKSHHDKRIHGTALKGKVHPKNMLVSDVRSDKIGKNAVDRFSLSHLVLKIFAFKVEELLIWRQPFDMQMKMI